MPERKRHILIDGFASNEAFRSKKTGRNPTVPLQNRFEHGPQLSLHYAELLTQYETQRLQIQNPITADIGIYIEIIGAPDCALPLDSCMRSTDPRRQDAATMI